jgi:serine/threonine protein phosphatase PrpC
MNDDNPATTPAVMTERRRQIHKGFGPDHDRRHTHGELLTAALAYLTGDPAWWPWPGPAPTERDRIKAAALVLAERDRQAIAADRQQPTLANATHIGGRSTNADAGSVVHTPLGGAAAVVDGIGSTPAVATAARLAADTAALVASHRGAQAGIMAAADTMPDYPGAPNAVGAVVSIGPDGRIEIAHVGDTAVWTWSATAGLRRWTVDQTTGEHVTHMLRNPHLTTADQQTLNRLGAATEVLTDYVLNGLAYATISTISWTPLRGENAEVDLILLTSDGVHKRLNADRIGELVARQANDAQALVDALVTAAITAPTDPDEEADNATAAVILTHRSQERTAA